jgi:hypothetical protein
VRSRHLWQGARRMRAVAPARVHRCGSAKRSTTRAMGAGAKSVVGEGQNNRLLFSNSHNETLYLRCFI